MCICICIKIKINQFFKLCISHMYYSNVSLSNVPGSNLSMTVKNNCLI